jgi:uncharacterized membrane protein YedE/YeeE
LAGICPGPAIANITGGDSKIWGFIAMMSLGMQSSSWLSKLFSINNK